MSSFIEVLIANENRSLFTMFAIMILLGIACLVVALFHPSM